MHENMLGSIVDTPDQHGFIMIGKTTLFLYHLPMFDMTNHRYQMIIEAEIPIGAMKQYQDAQAQSPTTPFVLGNKLTDLFTVPQISTGFRVSFMADIFQGIPDDPNSTVPLIPNVTTQIRRVVYFRPFDDSFTSPQHLTYVLFGANNEAHLAHYLTRSPDFDQILDLAQAPSWMPPLQLSSGMLINFPSLTSSQYTSNPLTQPTYPVSVGGLPETYQVEIGTTYYFNTALTAPTSESHAGSGD
jgi:hypothetical protein